MVQTRSTAKVIRVNVNAKENKFFFTMLARSGLLYEGMSRVTACQFFAPATVACHAEGKYIIPRGFNNLQQVTAPAAWLPYYGGVQGQHLIHPKSGGPNCVVCPLFVPVTCLCPCHAHACILLLYSNWSSSWHPLRARAALPYLGGRW